MKQPIPGRVLPFSFCTTVVKHSFPLITLTTSISPSLQGKNKKAGKTDAEAAAQNCTNFSAGKYKKVKLTPNLITK
jgi:hypothetical protein